VFPCAQWAPAPTRLQSIGLTIGENQPYYSLLQWTLAPPQAQLAAMSPASNRDPACSLQGYVFIDRGEPIRSASPAERPREASSLKWRIELVAEVTEGGLEKGGAKW